MNNKTSEANASEVLFTFYLFPNPKLRMPPDCAVLAVFDGQIEFLWLYNLGMSLTALELSPEALKKYRPLEAIRRRRKAKGPERAKRRRRAMTVARKAAELLRNEFGAKKVFIFGSLAKRGSFTLFSDIDLAVEGMPSRYYAAAETVYYLTPEFKIGLVELETCSPAMRENIERDGKP